MSLPFLKIKINNKECEVFICISPDFGRKVTKTPTLTYLQSMKDINLVDFSASEDFIANPGFYKDRDHLNFEGGRKYSESVAIEIKNTLGQE